MLKEKEKGQNVNQWEQAMKQHSRPKISTRNNRHKHKHRRKSEERVAKKGIIKASERGKAYTKTGRGSGLREEDKSESLVAVANTSPANFVDRQLMEEVVNNQQDIKPVCHT